MDRRCWLQHERSKRNNGVEARAVNDKKERLPPKTLFPSQRLRTLGLQGTELAHAAAGTIRQRLLKIGAMVTVSTRRVYIRLASAFPLQHVFAQAHRALAGLVPEEG